MISNIFVIDIVAEENSISEHEPSNFLQLNLLLWLVVVVAGGENYRKILELYLSTSLPPKASATLALPAAGSKGGA